MSRYQVWNRSLDAFADELTFATVLGAQDHKLDLAQRAVAKAEHEGRALKFTAAYDNLETKTV